MRPLTVCPSILAPGFSTFCPLARRLLFDGKTVSHIFPGTSPADPDYKNVQNTARHIGRISLSGVQPKFSAVVGEDLRLRYTRENERGHFILKPQPSSYHIINREFCAANENLSMQLASQVYRIETAANGLCFYENEEAAYITRRFDIHSGGKYMQEDFASLMGLTKSNGGADYKYSRASYEDCADVIRRHVKAYRIDLLRFFRLVLFNFISLNDDAHLKNFSLINNGNEYRLTPAYDLINTSLHLVNHRIFALDKGLFKEGMQFSDVRQVCRKDFEEFGRRTGLNDKTVQRELDFFAAIHSEAEQIISRSYLSEELKEQYRSSLDYRRKMLTF